jgi:uncharacterized protein YjiS (DUF1127 family)
MTTTTSRTLPVRTARPGPFRRLLTAFALRRSRARLADLPDHLLHDIGCTRAQAEAEAARPVWDVPDHWRRR